MYTMDDVREEEAVLDAYMSRHPNFQVNLYTLAVLLGHVQNDMPPGFTMYSADDELTEFQSEILEEFDWRDVWNRFLKLAQRHQQRGGNLFEPPDDCFLAGVTLGYWAILLPITAGPVYFFAGMSKSPAAADLVKIRREIYSELQAARLPLPAMSWARQKLSI